MLCVLTIHTQVIRPTSKPDFMKEIGRRLSESVLD